jgi:histidinol dehydrogenase
MKRYDWSALDEGQRRQALARPDRRRDNRVVSTVKKIFREVEREGAVAVARWAEKLDGHAPRRLDLDTKAVSAARKALDFEDLEALELAVENVARYHDAIRPQEMIVRPAPGVRCKRVWRPVQACGLYVPGGTAPLFSTLIMLALPALSAGVPERIAVTPPAKDGEVPPIMIAAAAACGLDSIWLVGGAHAIAALTYGAGVPRADKIFGPGNAYVAEAKRFAAELPGGPAIDLPAGPSELMVIADRDADPELIAADLLSQAEHDADAQVVLVCDDSAQIEDVARALEAQLADLPRAGIARKSLAEACAILVRTREESAEVANLYGPEHLSLQIEDAGSLVPLIGSAGTVFVGRFAAETFGDYVAGPSHVLPTDGAARTWSGVNVASFMTSFAVQEMDVEGARALARPAARLARLEGLEAHARAADLRRGNQP